MQRKFYTMAMEPAENGRSVWVIRRPDGLRAFRLEPHDREYGKDLLFNLNYPENRQVRRLLDDLGVGSVA